MQNQSEPTQSDRADPVVAFDLYDCTFLFLEDRISTLCNAHMGVENRVTGVDPDVIEYVRKCCKTTCATINAFVAERSNERKMRKELPLSVMCCEFIGVALDALASATVSRDTKELMWVLAKMHFVLSDRVRQTRCCACGRIIGTTRGDHPLSWRSGIARVTGSGQVAHVGCRSPTCEGTTTAQANDEDGRDGGGRVRRNLLPEFDLAAVATVPEFVDRKTTNEIGNPTDAN